MRYLTPELSRLWAKENKMAFIAGPRQVGKTTLAKHMLSAAGAGEFYFNWDIESHRKAILKNPETFWQMRGISGKNDRQRIVLDEIHKYPRWKRFLKGLYDSFGKDLEIIVTGSGRLDVYQRGGDSLLGRYNLYHLHPFTVGEVVRSDRNTACSPDEFWGNIADSHTPNGAKDALQAIETFTGFPEPLFAASTARFNRWRNSHRNLVIREDLRDLTRIREIGLIESLIMLLPEKIGSPLSINSLREDLGVNFATVLNWLESIERLYYLFKIRPFAGRMVRTLRREEKLYLYDFSVIEDDGPRFENLVALHLRKLCDLWTDFGFGEFSLHYVRDREKREVDFLITQANRPYALIETKLTSDDISPSLRYFGQHLKPRYTVQVVRHLSKSMTVSAGITTIAAERFLAFI